MLSKLLIAGGLMALCVAVHAFGLTLAFRWLKRRPSLSSASFAASAWALVCVAGWSVILHLVEIEIWAAFYAGIGAMSDFVSASYFSAVTYTTTGYGDLVLPEAWRLLGAIEALTGILMCGWSTGFFFAVGSRLHESPPTSAGAPAHDAP